MKTNAVIDHLPSREPCSAATVKSRNHISDERRQKKPRQKRRRHTEPEGPPALLRSRHQPAASRLVPPRRNIVRSILRNTLDATASKTPRGQPFKLFQPRGKGRVVTALDLSLTLPRPHFAPPPPAAGLEAATAALPFALPALGLTGVGSYSSSSSSSAADSKPSESLRRRKKAHAWDGGRGQGGGKAGGKRGKQLSKVNQNEAAAVERQQEVWRHGNSIERAKYTQGHTHR